MSEVDQAEVASAFQIGGIHGRPYTEWDGSGGDKPVSDKWEGYCTHGSVLFPVWHRPYVAVYEVSAYLRHLLSCVFASMLSRPAPFSIATPARSCIGCRKRVRNP